jgi:ribosome-associated protein
MKSVNYTPLGGVPLVELAKEFNYKAVRSSGAGGQHVNKVSTKVVVSFHIQKSTLLSEEEKSILCEKLAFKITSDGCLQVYHQSTRSQSTNKANASKIMLKLIEMAFRKEKPRRKTRPSLQAQNQRLQSKQLHSEKKRLRNFSTKNISIPGLQNSDV